VIAGEGPLVVGRVPVRTGVTVILPHAAQVGGDPVFAGAHVLNGNGEMTGRTWLVESGMLTTPVALTNTHSVGLVRDALIAYDVARTGGQRTDGQPAQAWSLPRRRRGLGRVPLRPQRAACARGACWRRTRPCSPDSAVGAPSGPRST